MNKRGVKMSCSGLKGAFSFVSGLILVLLNCGSCGAQGPLARITVDAEAYRRCDTPVCAILDGIVDAQRAAGLQLVETTAGQRVTVPMQAEPGEAVKLWWILSGTTAAGTRRVYELVPKPARREQAEISSRVTSRKGRELDVYSAGKAVQQNRRVFEVKKNDTFLQIQAGNAKVLRYHYTAVPPPEGASSLYTRSGFIHPLWSPSQQVLTNIHPADHIHHMGLWMPWTKTEFEGRSVDFWNLGKAEGTVRFVGFDSVTDGPVFAGFKARHEHVDLTAPGGEKIALNEVWDVRVWNVGGPKQGYWLLDFVSTQRCASASPLHLVKYRYGGFGFRATGQWQPPDCGYLTSEGRTRKDGHATRARWCKVFGRTPAGRAGVLFMSHPANYQHPEPMRIWPEGDIFFNFCPVQKTDRTLEPGNDYVLRYRLFIYDGTLGCDRAERLWQDFGRPPKVEVLGN